MDASVNTLLDMFNANLKQLLEIWEVIGYSEDAVKDRVNIVEKNVADLLKSMVEEEKDNQAKLADSIESMLSEAAALCREIGVDYIALTAGLEDKSVPLKRVAEILEEKLELCRETKAKRLAEYGALLAAEAAICVALGVEKKAGLPGVPTPAQLEEFSEYIAGKKEEEQQLREGYNEVRRNIADILQELGAVADSAFLQEVLSGGMCLSAENMERLNEAFADVLRRREVAKETGEELRSKLSNLWERLQVSYEDREAFLSGHRGYSARVVDALRAEIEKCEVQKRENIQVFVEAVRREIADWWDKCCFGPDQRSEFSAFYSDCYNEDLLELHELEAARLRRYFEAHINILELGKKWYSLRSRKVELETKAQDPNRLFANRGGQLLREEKERKTIQKQLPAIEEELRKYVEEYESKERMPFYYKGEDLGRELRGKRDIQLAEHVTKKRGVCYTEAPKTVGCPTLKVPSVTKRRINKTPATVPAKMPKPMHPAVDSGKNIARRIFNQNENIVPVPGPTGVNLHDTGFVEPSYADFQLALESKPSARSTVAPMQRPLTGHNVPSALSKLPLPKH